MTGDPKRWALDGAGSTREEREILRAAAGLDVDPPPGSEKAVWAALALHVGAGGVGGAGGASGASGGAGGGGASAGGAGQAAAGSAGQAAAGSAGQAAGGGALAAGGGGAAGGAVGGAGAAGAAGMASAAGAAGVLKSVLIGAAGAGLLVSSYVAIGPESPAPTAPEPAVTAIAPSNPEAAPTSAQPREQPQAMPPVATDVPVTPPEQPQAAEPAAPRPGRISPPPTEAAPPPEALAPPAAPPEPSAAPSAQPLTPAERANQLREESRLLGEARDALRRGDASGALQKIEEARGRFGGGMLGQEREALTIEALYKSGQKGAASARAAAFLKAYPKSPHAARLQSFLQ